MSRRERDLETRVRRRVAEALTAAGVDGGRVAREVLLMMPEDFVRAYERLYLQALSVGGGGTDAGGSSTHDHGSGRAIVRDEIALRVKKDVDYKLRQLARSIPARLSRRRREVEREDSGRGPERRPGRTQSEGSS